MKNNSELIVMLTWKDKTVENAIEVFESAKHTNVNYWGFKEVGLPREDMIKLVRLIHDEKKTAVLEVVAYTEDACIEGAKVCAECGFDILMGTMYFESVQRIAEDNGIIYYQFVGTIEGRPSVLKGTIEGMIEEANGLIRDKGIKGFDLLGYRYTGDAVKLNQEFARQVKGNVCLAGSVSGFQRLSEIKRTGAWAFTIGGAFFEKKFCEGSFADNINAVLEYLDKEGDA